MSERFVKHGTFVVERTYPATRERVYQAWADLDAKVKWFSKPDIFEFRIGGREYSSGEIAEGGPLFVYDAVYQDIVPNERIIYTYIMDMGGVRISASITTIELLDVEEGTRLIFTEQGAFLDGHDTVEIREHGTGELLDALGRSLTEPAAADDGLELITSRIYDVPRELAFAAWTTPDQLAEWWGPEGFTNTFHEIDYSPGGVWRLTMHGPDGKDYPNRNTFIEIAPNERIVLEHAEAPAFRVTALFEEAEGGTRVTFRQCFRHAEELEPIRVMCEKSNEQNLDRMGRVLEKAKRLSL
jgi:uncharacterized protein YndB with AHSA1/START domain